MGYLALKDLGTLEVYTDGGKFYGRNPSPDGVINPIDNYGTVNLRSYQLTFDTGTTLDDNANISGNTTRLAIGSKKSIPFILSAKFNRADSEEESNKITNEDMRVISYLTAWSRNRTILMMFWMPNTNSTDWLLYGQEKDFYTSQLKTIYDVIWDNNLGSSNDGYGTTLYGTNHFELTMDGAIGTYNACAVPVIIEGINVKSLANSHYIDVSVQGHFVENEGR